MHAGLQCEGFHDLDLMCCVAITPCLSGRKLAPHFGLQIYTVSLRLEHIIFTTKSKNHPCKVTSNSSSYALEAKHGKSYPIVDESATLLLFVRKIFSYMAYRGL